MSDQNASAPAPLFIPACGSIGCMMCPQVPNPGGVPLSGMTPDGSIFASGFITTTTLRQPEPEPEPLTVKQAAKAYRKANRAYAAAQQAHSDAQAAVEAARDDLGKAVDVVNAAQVELEKAAAR